MELQQKAGMGDVLFPGTEQRKKEVWKFIARFLGQIPDAYDAFAAGVALEYIDSEHEEREFNWVKAVEHPAVRAMADMTVSMGVGKGRKEGVELGKSNPPLPQESRWSFRRGRK